MQGMQAPAANGEGYGASTAASPSPRLDGQLRNLLGTFWAVRVASGLGGGNRQKPPRGRGSPEPHLTPPPPPLSCPRGLQAPHQPGQPGFKFTVAESCDRIKDEFQFLQAQYHR